MNSTPPLAPTPADLHPPRPTGQAGVVDALTFHKHRLLRTPDFEIDVLDRCVRYPDGEEVRFTAHQWRVLEALVRAAPAPVTGESLRQQTLDRDSLESDRQLPVLISQLRRKLEPDPRSPRYFHTLDGDRYAFDPTGHCHPSRRMRRPPGSGPEPSR